MGASSSNKIESPKPASKPACGEDGGACSLESKPKPVVEKKPPCKACCACPETKKARDAW